MTYGFGGPRGPRRDHPFGFTPPPPKVGVAYGELPFLTNLQDAGLPETGFSIGVREIGGWWSPAPDDTQSVPAPSGDGLLSLSSRLEARPVVLRGWVYAPHGLGALEDALDAVARRRSGVLEVRERTRDLWREADVRLVSVDVDRVSAVWAKVVLSFRADDPLRYGTGVQDLRNGRNVLLNPGDATSFPIVEVTGPTQQLVVNHSAGDFVLPAVPAGQSRVVDAREGVVFNGDGERISFPWSPLPRVEAGGAEWQVSGIGSGGAVVRRFQAWT